MERHAITTEIAFAIPDSYVGIVTGLQELLEQDLHIGGGIIDPDYRGPVKVIFFNLTDKHYHVTPGMAIARLLLAPTYSLVVEEATALSSTDRAAQGFGSTGLQ